jgi:hypothetical protein
MSSTEFSSKFRPYRAVLAGFCGSTVATVILLFSYIMAQLLARSTGEGSALHALAYNNLTALVESHLYVTAVAHFVLGTLFALAYARLVDQLPGRNSWRSGLVYGLGLWLLSAVIFFPLMGAGFFALQLGAGLLPVLGSLILHLAYGGVLGLIYSPYLASFGVNAMAQHPGAVPHQLSSTPSEKAAAKGILGGAALGSLLVGVAWLLGQGDSMTVSGLPLDYTLMAVVFFFTTVGMLIGFWTGAPDGEPSRTWRRRAL